MGHQPKLWYESLDDATRAAVDAAGGPKAVGAKVWPHLDPTAAGNKLRACLSEGHQQKFDLSEWFMVLEIAHGTGDDSIMQFLAQRLGYEIKPLSPTEAKARVEKAEMKALLAEIAKRVETWGSK